MSKEKELTEPPDIDGDGELLCPRCGSHLAVVQEYLARDTLRYDTAAIDSSTGVVTVAATGVRSNDAFGDSIVYVICDGRYVEGVWTFCDGYRYEQVQTEWM